MLILIEFNDFQKITPYEWEIDQNFRDDMRVPVRIFASQDLLQAAMGDNSVEQAINVTTLPGVVGSVVVMPDMHQGYGFPIGGVAATSLVDGVISPGGIGYDINCGVRLLATRIPFEVAEPHLKNLAISLYQHCPSGVGVSSSNKLSRKELTEVCELGSQWALKKGYATEMSIRRTEDSGRLSGADPEKMSERALERGLSQLGTLGSGNHFIEVGIVDQIFSEEIAGVFGLEKNMLTVMIHSGSRGLGHQVCTDYVRIFQKSGRKFGIQIPDRELVCAPLSSEEGQNYLAAMRAAANYAFCNRQMLAFQAQRAFEQVFAGITKDFSLFQVYDVAHNIGKIETHVIGNQKMDVCVHRKGATRAFGPGSKDLPEEYAKSGQPVLVPGSMGTSSWVLAGSNMSMEKSFGSCCHGAGRVMSRSKAKRQIRGDELLRSLEKEGIYIQAGSLPGLAEEAPQAYKDVDEVIEVVVEAGLAQKVARLRPLAVVKG